MQGVANEGNYEVLEYQTTLELHDDKGKKASVKKCEKVRYLQNNVIAYQDQAWGDGNTLMNYRCNPGKPVDFYRSGYKTYVLISLREVKHKGDIDEFKIEWGIHGGFLKQSGFWGTEINHQTKEISIMVIFPRNRPPARTWITEQDFQKTRYLDVNARRKLPDGRWSVTWKRLNPRLYEQYVLNWEW